MTRIARSADRRRRFTLELLVLAGASLLLAGSVRAEVVQRHNWVPAGTYGPVGRSGDLWTFVCPKGGTVGVTVDNATDADTPGALTGIDPVIYIYDGAGNSLAVVDDSIDCTNPKCGSTNAFHRCPQVLVACGTGTTHSLVVRDFGTCAGAYSLSLEVRDAKGMSLPEKKVKLGGGAKAKAPKWLPRALRVGPAIDDAEVPTF
jgi:hypothetical protein